MPMSSINPSSAGLRALAHPTRLRLLRLLRVDGPATATSLARALQLNTGATSYHLRHLAEHGIVVEDTELGAGRERWWRAAHQSTRADIAARGQDEDDDVDAYQQAVALQYTEALMQAVTERRHLPKEWQQASVTSDWLIRLTPARAEALVTALSGLIEQWAEDEDDDETAATFVVNLNGFPRPGTVVREDGAR